MSDIRMWYPKDKNEAPRLVRVIRIVYVDGMVAGAWVIECDRELPGIGFAHLLELRRARHE